MEGHVCRVRLGNLKLSYKDLEHFKFRREEVMQNGNILSSLSLYSCFLVMITMMLDRTRKR